MAVGDIYEGNPSRWTDEETGRTIIQPIAQDLNRHMYFTSNPFTRNGNELVFTAVRDGKENFYLLNYISGQYKQLTDHGGLAPFISKAYYDKVRHVLYYGLDTDIYAINIESLEQKLMYRLDDPVASIAITCDGKYLVSSCMINSTKYNNDGQALKLAYHKMFKIDLQSFEISTILYRSTPIDHIQCNPVNPDYILYCEWGYHCTHHRIWCTNLDGTKGGPVGPEQPNEHRTHEYFTRDGKKIAYHGKFMYMDDKANFNSVTHTWGVMNLDGTEDEYWNCVPQGHQAGHSIISFDGTMIASDGNGYISLVKRSNDAGKTAKFIPVAAHKSSMSGNFVHPHPSFSIDDRYILFATDFGGKDRGNIYLVDMDSGKGRIRL